MQRICNLTLFANAEQIIFEHSKIIMARFSRQITTPSKNIIIQFPEKNALIFSSNRNTKIITFQIPEKNLSNRNV